MEKISEIKCAPVIGNYYLVLCVKWGNDDFYVPLVHETAHAEPELGSERPHIHVDYRFMTKEQLKTCHFDLKKILGGRSIPALTAKNNFPAITERPFQCLRQFYPYAFIVNDTSLYETLEDRFVDSCLDLSCPVCPHKGMPLNSVEVINGVISCPAHGLTFSAVDGSLIRKNSL